MTFPGLFQERRGFGLVQDFDSRAFCQLELAV